MTVPLIHAAIAGAVVLAAFVILTVLLVRYRRQVQQNEEPSVGQPEATTPRRAAVIVNPSKFADLGDVQDLITKVCLSAGWAEPLFIETTVDDPGCGQTSQALEAGVDLVCPLGGDGTVRDVAQALVHTGVPMGLLPGGTGNLLARNLDLPIDSIEDALLVALNGVDKAIDVGQVIFDQSGEDQRPDEKVFLVMAGLGFDAAMMADAPEKLKAKVGWLAYAFSGARNLNGPRAKARIRPDDHPEFTRRMQTVLVGNCGTLTGGIQLLPDALVDDGWLDTVILSPKGIASWTVVAARVLTRQGHHRVERMRCRQLSVRVDRPTEGQLDGDAVGKVRAVRVRVDPQALVVRLPSSTSGRTT